MGHDDEMDYLQTRLDFDEFIRGVDAALNPGGNCLKWPYLLTDEERKLVKARLRELSDADT